MVSSTTIPITLVPLVVPTPTTNTTRGSSSGLTPRVRPLLTLGGLWVEGLGGHKWGEFVGLVRRDPVERQRQEIVKQLELHQKPYPLQQLPLVQLQQVGGLCGPLLDLYHLFGVPFYVYGRHALLNFVMMALSVRSRNV